LSFAPGPKFGRLLREPEDLKHYHQPEDAQSFFWFQRVALDKLREQLPNSKGLIGFVGGLATLYAFAVEGSTKGDLSSAMKGLDDGRFEGLMDMLLPVLVDNMSVQAEANISCIAILDSGLGHFPYDWVVKSYLNVLRELLTRFKYRFPETKILYYSLGVRADYFEHLIDLPIDALGIDHHKELPELFERYGERFILQGNIPPEWISLPVEEYAGKLRGFLNLMEVLPEHYRNRWICGLGHGILPTAKEENVYMSIKTVRERLGGK
jgi:uroporphyrinogen decarboxylase